MLTPTGVRSFNFRNDSGETIPAFGIVRIDGAEVADNNRLVLIGKKPNGSGKIHYINGGVEVANGSFGSCAVASGPVWAKYDTGDTPSVGESWGPVSGSWELGIDGGGFKIVGGETEGRVLVESSASECPDRNEIHHLTIIGSPTGGTLACRLLVDATAATLTFNWNDAAAAVQATLETHPEIAGGDVAVTGGPFPNATIAIEFQGSLSGKAIALPILDWASLTGGSGVAAIPSRPQSGFPD